MKTLASATGLTRTPRAGVLVSLRDAGLVTNTATGAQPLELDTAAHALLHHPGHHTANSICPTDVPATALPWAPLVGAPVAR